MPHRQPFDPRQQGRAGPDTFTDALAIPPADDADDKPVEQQPWGLIYAITYGTLVMPTAMALALWFKGASWHGFVTTILLTHVALVLSFLGGMHWGIAMRYVATNARMPAFHFIWGPIPGYACWFALMAEARVALGIMVIIMLWTYWIDQRTWPGSGLGPWLPLRRVFTVGTLIYCAIAIAGLSR